MVDISNARPHALRIVLVVSVLLGVFLFLDPIGFASSSMANQTPGTTNFITHIVLFEFKPNAGATAVDAACAKFLALKDNCLAPNSQHPYITGISGGKYNSNEGLQNGLTHGFIVHFANADDRNYYVEQDPAHQAFKKEIEPLIAKTTVLDFTNGKF
ncbi:dabb-domain-containing protein [Canariomyces notabilis]|uniref:Dabb-domain-containing protein n=1 Tax=Canariomyces notabilis TaxID=2074819 RepID=A0AAN6T7I1_9PEZI|nr:dabb-domain-containing protein [Canariomyces arenarius]